MTGSEDSAAETSARLDDLMRLREDLVMWMADAPVDRKAALIAQFRATIAEIEELSPKKAAGDGIDEVAARRAARRAGATQDQDRSKRKG